MTGELGLLKSQAFCQTTPLPEGGHTLNVAPPLHLRGNPLAPCQKTRNKSETMTYLIQCRLLKLA